MVQISQELENEIRRRAARGDFATLDDLLRAALQALDREQALDALLLEGINSGFEPFTDQDLDDIRREGLEQIRRERDR